MTSAPPIPSKKGPKPCPKAVRRSERRQHILELLTVEQPRCTEEIAFFVRESQGDIGSVLARMEAARLIRRASPKRGPGAPSDAPPNLWALRCWRENTPVEPPAVGSNDSSHE